MTTWLVTWTSMTVEADTADDAIHMASETSGGHWEAIPLPRPPAPTSEQDACEEDT